MTTNDSGKCPYVLPVTDEKEVRVVGFSDGLPGQNNIKVKSRDAVPIVGWLLSEAIKHAHCTNPRGGGRPCRVDRDRDDGELIRTYEWNDLVVETRTREGRYDVVMDVWDRGELVMSLDADECAMLDVQLRRLETMFAEDARIAAQPRRTRSPARTETTDGTLLHAPAA